MNLQMQYQAYNNGQVGNNTAAASQQYTVMNGAVGAGQSGSFTNQNNNMDSPNLFNIQMQNMIKTEGMGNPLANQLAMQQAMHNLNFYGGNATALYQNQAQRMGNDGNILNGQTGGTSNQNLQSTSYLEGNGPSYKQYLKTQKGSNQQLTEYNNSSNSSAPQISVSQFKNKKIIVKHANIVKKKRQIKIWTSEEDELLKHLCEQLPGKWNEIAQQILGRNASQCSQRWRRILPTKVRKPWTNEEDMKVLDLSEKYGKNWGMIAQHIEGKTGKQVRERYINKLDPSIKRTPWTEEEDQKILDMFLDQGPKWSSISNELVGRPENTVKNRFYSHISRIYLSDDSSYIGNKNMNNTQKVKDACSKLPHSAITAPLQKQKKTVQSSQRGQQNVIEEEENDEDDENEDDDDDENGDDDEDEDEMDHEDEEEHNNPISILPQFAHPHLLSSAPPPNNVILNPLYQDPSKKRAQLKMLNNASNIQVSMSNNNYQNTSMNNSNDRRNLKIEEQEDQDEELMEENPQLDQEEEDEVHNVQNKLTNCGLPQMASYAGISQPREQQQQQISNQTEKDGSEQKSPQQISSLGLITNPMLAKRGKIIKNIEIPKANQNTSGLSGMNMNTQNITNNAYNSNNTSSSNNNGSVNESGDNALTGVGMISSNNLDFLTGQTPQPQYYQNLGLFTNSQLTPMYLPGGSMHQHLQSQQMNQGGNSNNQHETNSPMFILGNNMNSPAPRSSLPLFKPPMTTMGNTTPSAITPLMPNNYNQYLVYAPHHQSLGMLTPSAFSGYNHMMSPFYMKAPNSTVFPSLSKIGQSNITDVEKTPLETSENNNFLYLLNNSSNVNNQQTQSFQNMFDNNLLQLQPHQNINTNNNGMNMPNNGSQSESTNQNQENNHIHANAGNKQHLQMSGDGTEAQQKTQGLLDDVASQQHPQQRETKQQGGDPQRKFQLDNLLKEFSSLDPETQKRFQMMIQGQKGGAETSEKQGQSDQNFKKDDDNGRKIMSSHH